MRLLEIAFTEPLSGNLFIEEVSGMGVMPKRIGDPKGNGSADSAQDGNAVSADAVAAEVNSFFPSPSGDRQ